MSKYIRLTRKVIEEMFDECNNTYFGDKVEKPIKIELFTHSKKTLGMVRPVKNKKGEISSILHISNRYRWTRENLRHVVVHEMIHLEIEDYKTTLTFLQRLPLIGGFFITEHDERFISRMNEINEKYGLNIKIRFKEMRKDRKY